MYYYQTLNSPLGQLHLVADKESLVALYTLEDKAPNLLSEAKLSNRHEVLSQTKKELEEYFDGKRTNFTVPLNPAGTKFQASVWDALLKIPFGKVWSYREQAKFLKNPKAQRAVGGANGKNPIPIIIPCHRVVGSTGKLTGFSGGMKMKIFLLKLEGHELNTHGLKII